MAALQLSPGQPEALRAVARYLTRLHSIEALDFWKELSEKTSLTRLDVRDEAMIAIIAGDIALADTAMNELIDSLAEPADRHALRASVVSLAGRMGFGFCTDPGAVPGVAELAGALDASLEELSGLC